MIDEADEAMLSPASSTSARKRTSSESSTTSSLSSPVPISSPRPFKRKQGWHLKSSDTNGRVDINVDILQNLGLAWHQCSQLAGPLPRNVPSKFFLSPSPSPSGSPVPSPLYSEPLGSPGVLPSRWSNYLQFLLLQLLVFHRFSRIIMYCVHFY